MPITESLDFSRGVEALLLTHRYRNGRSETVLMPVRIVSGHGWYTIYTGYGLKIGDARRSWQIESMFHNGTLILDVPPENDITELAPLDDIL